MRAHEHSNYKFKIFEPHVDTLVSLVCSSVNEAFYKVGSMALLVLQSLIVVLRQLADGKVKLEPHLEKIHEVIIGKLRLNDIDQVAKRMRSLRRSISARI